MSIGSFPRVRPNLRYVPQVQEGKALFVVKDPISLKYFRFGEAEVWLMRQMDGTRPLGRIVEALETHLGVRTTEAALDAFHRRLKEIGLAERSQAERSVLVLEALRQQRRSRLRGSGNTLLRMRFSLGDPDVLFDRIVHRIRFFWSPAFVGLSAAAFLLYGVIVALNWAPFTAGIAALYDPASYSLGFILILYLTVVVVTVIHEFGHGLTCKHFGGEVHEIGGLLLYFSPGMYCNVNDAWTFEKRAHRLWVTFAGPWIELFVASVAAVIWIVAEPGTFVHEVAFITVLVAGGLAVIFNLNPLIPLDGYFALMDWLEVPNLRARSFEYVGAFLKRSVLRMEVALPEVTPSERRIFLLYGCLAFLYSFVLLLLVGLWAAGVLTDWLGAWGWVIVALGVGLLARKYVRRYGRVIRDWAAGRAWRSRRVLGAAAGMVLVLLLAGLVPWTVRVRGDAVVEPVQRTWLRTAEAGWVASVRTREGALVQAGDTLAVLRNPELEIAWTSARAKVAALAGEAAAARARGNTALARRTELQLDAQRTHFAQLDRRRSGLVLRAPFSGTVVTPRPDELVGARAAPGDSLLELWSSGPMRVRVVLAERDAGEVAVGSAVGLKFPVLADWTWRTRVQQVSPAARERQVDLLAPLGGAAVGGESSLLRPGMVGRAKIDVLRTNLAGAVARAIRRSFRTDWLL